MDRKQKGNVSSLHCEEGNELLDFIKTEKFRDDLAFSHLLKKEYAPWCYFLRVT